MRHYYDQDRDRSIDLTPMLDVVFIMLIFFIVTATFVKETGLDINPPEPNIEPPNSKPKNVLVRIAANNRIYIDKRNIDVRNVRANFERLHALNPDTSVVINAHPESNVDTTVRVMDNARLTGIDSIKFAE